MHKIQFTEKMTESKGTFIISCFALIAQNRLACENDGCDRNYKNLHSLHIKSIPLFPYSIRKIRLLALKVRILYGICKLLTIVICPFILFICNECTFFSLQSLQNHKYFILARM